MECEETRADPGGCERHWKDDLRREMFQHGSLPDRAHEEGLTSVIFNPAICNLVPATIGAYPMLPD
jgi:hypothetical protein